MIFYVVEDLVASSERFLQDEVRILDQKDAGEDGAVEDRQIGVRAEPDPEYKRAFLVGEVFHPVLTAIAEGTEESVKEGNAPSPVTEVTEELLRSGRAYFYSCSAYQVEKTTGDKTLLVTLTDPNGVTYAYGSTWVYMPECMAEDIWYLSLKEMGLTKGLDRNGYPAGVYRMAYYVDGDLADAFEFELK